MGQIGFRFRLIEANGGSEGAKRMSYYMTLQQGGRRLLRCVWVLVLGWLQMRTSS